MMFGHIDCAKCGHRHPESDDCDGRRSLLVEQMANRIIVNADPVCRSFLRGQPIQLERSESCIGMAMRGRAE